MGEQARARLKRVMLKTLLDIDCSVGDVDDIWDDLPVSKLNILNWASLLTSGIGDDFVYLNEHMAEGKTILDFSTLYDYDYDNYKFQEKANKSEFPDYQGSNYYAYKHPSWARLLIDNNFYYASFLSLATYLIDEIDSAGGDCIRALIPHDFVKGESHGKPEREYQWLATSVFSQRTLSIGILTKGPQQDCSKTK